jgi:hypothetical protein
MKSVRIVTFRTPANNILSCEELSTRTKKTLKDVAKDNASQLPLPRVLASIHLVRTLCDHRVSMSAIYSQQLYIFQANYLNSKRRSRNSYKSHLCHSSFAAHMVEEFTK